LQNQLFHPFSQENPLQTGTGLGLAIVNSIVQSKGVEGKVDVWSAENVGTEIKVTFQAEVVRHEGDSLLTHVDSPLRLEEPYLVSLIGFNDEHRGVQLLRRVVVHYVVDWWGCSLAPTDDAGHVAIVNEDTAPVVDALRRRDSTRPFVILTTSRGDDHLMGIVNEYERIGGFCRVLYKPGGPSRLRAMLKLCLHALKISRHSTPKLTTADGAVAHIPGDSPPVPFELSGEHGSAPAPVTRRYSEDQPAAGTSALMRPGMGPRSITVHPAGTWSDLPPEPGEPYDPYDYDGNGRRRARSSSQASPLSPTIAVGMGATLLKSSLGSLGARKGARVLVVEDNNILRNLLWVPSFLYSRCGSGADVVCVCVCACVRVYVCAASDGCKARVTNTETLSTAGKAFGCTSPMATLSDWTLATLQAMADVFLQRRLAGYVDACPRWRRRDD
jgi:hypothetical protein